MSHRRPELLAPFGANARSDLARVIRTRHYDAVASTAREGFICTTPAETILTLSLRLPAGRIERLVDQELAKRKLGAREFDPIFERLAWARQPGLRALRGIIRSRSDDAYQPPTSELERLLYSVLDRPEIPPYERQLPIRYPAFEATVDAYIPIWKMIVEGDGRRWHTEAEHFEADRERDNQALAAGMAVMRFTWKKLRYNPERCLEGLLAAGSHRLGA